MASHIVRASLALLLVWSGAALAHDPDAASAVASAAAPEIAVNFVEFGQDFASLCVGRNGVEITVRNTHPTRKLRAWFDRYHMGTGTGDRSRSELAPHADPEPLGCSRTEYGVQEWRLVRAEFID